ncbi:LexA family protein [Luteimonas sp. MHLX1A]|uniref:LexA family protein n=1 Tax=Alterluteimonas muca TaxID=2878684 RepID=UPI001E4CAB0E|nr:S24 family peptidase [Luteimonas sp. MHLX1A]MCD9046789.1 S24 family peptidase [Luteimonas sp. MHLX1A]
MHETTAILIGQPDLEPPLELLPVGSVRAQLGFPSPAEDFEEDGLDLNRILVRNPLATYIYRASGWSMAGAGILDNDLLLCDRSITPRSGDVVLATWDGNQPACKILRLAENHLELHSANPDIPPIVLEPGTEVEVFAIVGVARTMKRGGGARG